MNKNKKSILFVLPGFTFGGTVFSTLNMISLLDTNRCDIDVLPMTYQGPVKKYYKECSNLNILPEQIGLSALMGRMKNETNLLRKMYFFSFKAASRILNLVGKDGRQIIFNYYAHKIDKTKHYDCVHYCPRKSVNILAKRHILNSLTIV